MKLGAMKPFKEVKQKILEITTGGNGYYIQMKLLVYPVSIRVVYLASKYGIHPNVLTGFSGLFSVICLILFWNEMFALSLVSFWIRTVFDYSDGATARFTNRESKIGGILDGTIDKIFYVSLWMLISLTTSSEILRYYYWISYILYFVVVQYFILPRLGFLKNRAPLKQYFLDRGVLIGIGIATELEFWSLVMFAFGVGSEFIVVLVALNNIDLIYRVYEILRYQNVSLMKKM
jgi:phosphatidylglycerophosphate synthase